MEQAQGKDIRTEVQAGKDRPQVQVMDRGKSKDMDKRLELQEDMDRP
jgi:hypothetical protein